MKIFWLLFLPLIVIGQEYTYVDSIGLTAGTSRSFFDNANAKYGGLMWVATSSYSIGKIETRIRPDASPTMNITPSVYNNNDGSTEPSTQVGVNGTVYNAASLPAGANWVAVGIFPTPIAVTSGDTLWFVMDSDAQDGTNKVTIFRENAGGIAPKHGVQSADALTWTNESFYPMGLKIYSVPVSESKGYKTFNKYTGYKK